MTDYGMQVIESGIKDPKDPKDFLINSENVLLKLHKHASFNVRHVSGSGSATIPHILGYRPLVISYCQRFESDGSIDTNYHLMDFSYFGATQAGEYYVEVYTDRIKIIVEDSDPDIPGIADIKGYYFIFEEEVTG